MLFHCCELCARVLITADRSPGQRVRRREMTSLARPTHRSPHRGIGHRRASGPVRRQPRTAANCPQDEKQQPRATIHNRVATLRNRGWSILVGTLGHLRGNQHPVFIEQPEGVETIIVRDVFGARCRSPAAARGLTDELQSRPQHRSTTSHGSYCARYLWLSCLGALLLGFGSWPAPSPCRSLRGRMAPASCWARSITIAATADGGGQPISRVRFMSGNTIAGADTSAPYSFEYAPSAVGT